LTLFVSGILSYSHLSAPTRLNLFRFSKPPRCSEFRETHASEGGFANIHELKLVGMPTKQIHKIARMLVNQQLGAF
jgi:hypothetical protein